MNISDRLKQKVDEKYHTQIDMIADILDPNQEYKITFMRNRARMELLLKEYNEDPSNLYISLLTLYGDIITNVKFRVVGDFVVALLKITKETPQRTFKEEYHIIIYEADNKVYFS